MSEGIQPLEDQHPQLASATIDWQIPNDLHSQLATHLVVQSGPDGFIISFFEVRSPILLGSPEKIRAEVEKIKSVPAICVARVVVPIGHMPDFLKVLNENWEQFQSSIQKPE